jgi:hypothetical protein
LTRVKRASHGRKPLAQATEAAFPLCHPYLEASIERAQGCLDLVDSRCVMQVE